MKHIKKLASLLLAVVMILALATTAFATGTTTKKGEGNFTVTITKDSTDMATHTYEAYQIFTGDLTVTGDTKTLSNVEWGTGIDRDKVSTLITALNAIESKPYDTIAATATAKDVQEALSKVNDNATDSAVEKAIAEAFYNALSNTKTGTGSDTGVSGLTAGYYLIKDGDLTGDATGKNDKPGAKTRYILQVVGNVTVTEKADVPTVTKKVKEKNDTTGVVTGWQDAADFDLDDTISYQITGTLPTNFLDYKTYTFTDKLSAGLDLPVVADVKVYLVKADNARTDITGNFDVTLDATNNKLTVSLKSDKDLRTIASAATDKIVVEYTSKLNSSAVIGSAGNPNTVDLTFSNNPNAAGSGDYDTTPEDKVTVFTYQISAKKTDKDGNALSGAGFTLYKYVQTAAADAANGTPATYEWQAVGSEVTGVTTFNFKRVDAGVYKLVETTVPGGYNKADDVYFEVVASYDTTADDPKLTALDVYASDATGTKGNKISEGTTATFTTAVNTGTVTTSIKNFQGATLPTTGGIGTTIFYVTGAVLALGAGILLITKRRMSR